MKNNMQKMTGKTTSISRKSYLQCVHYVMKTQCKNDELYAGYEHAQSKLIAMNDRISQYAYLCNVFQTYGCSSAMHFTLQHSRKIKLNRNIAMVIKQKTDNFKHITIPHVQHYHDGVNVFFGLHYPLPIFFDEDVFLSWIEIDDNVFDYMCFVIFDDNVLKNKIHFLNVLGSLRFSDYHKTTHVMQMKYAMKYGFYVEPPSLFAQMPLRSDETPQLLTTHQCLCDFPPYAKYVKDFFVFRMFAIISFHEQTFENYEPNCIVHRVFSDNFLVKTICKNFCM